MLPGRQHVAWCKRGFKLFEAIGLGGAETIGRYDRVTRIC